MCQEFEEEHIDKQRTVERSQNTSSKNQRGLKHFRIRPHANGYHQRPMDGEQGRRPEQSFRNVSGGNCGERIPFEQYHRRSGSRAPPSILEQLGRNKSSRRSSPRRKAISSSSSSSSPSLSLRGGACSTV
mmetsp:Transcript_3196/g.4628  ORF Transcript_3196/g.4628 Transcript_3196/m.4628 type:complete len:130 (+) Transcript_3196:611-1000(+)